MSLEQTEAQMAMVAHLYEISCQLSRIGDGIEEAIQLWKNEPRTLQPGQDYRAPRPMPPDPRAA